MESTCEWSKVQINSSCPKIWPIHESCQAGFQRWVMVCPLTTSRQLPTVCNDDWLGSLTRLRSDCLYLLDDVHALGNGAKDDMLAIEPLRLNCTEEELRAVGVRACVGHGENAWACMFEGEVFVSELAPTDRLSSSTIASREVTTLAHEVSTHTVECAA